ncbi:MAG: permease-like cell division protein FtsX [Gammaproteobacteria bacterium]
MKKTKLNKEVKPTRFVRGGAADKLHAYANIHAHALFSSLGRLMRSSFTSMMTVTVLSITISMAAGFYLLVANMQQLAGNLEDSDKISVFLKVSVSDEAGKKLADKIGKFPDVQHVSLITKAEAMAEFRHYSGFGEALDALEKNPLPTVIQVLPKNELNDLKRLDKLLQSLEALAEVDFAQLDMQWVKRLRSIMVLAERGVSLLCILLGFAIVFITGNTIRLELQNRREEVVIAKLVGATDSFIRRPFLYTGFWLGLGSGIAAWIIVTLLMFSLHQPVRRLSELYEGNFEVNYLNFYETLMLLLISSLLGIIGSWIVLKFQLRELRPE